MIITAENAEAFEKGISMLDRGLNELKRIAENLAPQVRESIDLDKALQAFCSHVNQRAQVRLTYFAAGLAPNAITGDNAVVVYKIIEELVNNIVQHAYAKNALVQLAQKERVVTVTVQDDGKGFDGAVLKTINSTGYTRLQKSMANLGGTIHLQTAPGKGTAINIEIPITAETQNIS